MIGNTSIWETINLFEYIKKDNLGFKYKIKGKHEIVLWRTDEEQQ